MTRAPYGESNSGTRSATTRSIVDTTEPSITPYTLTSVIGWMPGTVSRAMATDPGCVFVRR